MRYSWCKETVFPCNWKTAIDAFVEAYHVPGSHPQLARADHDNHNPVSVRELQTNGRYSPTETFYRHAKFTTQPVTSKTSADTWRYDITADKGTDPREAIAALARYYARELGNFTERDLRAAEELRSTAVPDGHTASSFFVELRKKHAIDDGLDWQDITPEQWSVAGNDWHIFPNMVILPNQGTCLGYRARPNGLDPDSCLFEAYVLEQIPIANYDVNTDFQPQFFPDWRDGSFGEILNQDFANMSEVTLGMHSRSFDGHRLNRIQETSVHHHHVVADRYIWNTHP
jgi:hypothetical protein